MEESKSSELETVKIEIKESKPTELETVKRVILELQAELKEAKTAWVEATRGNKPETGDRWWAELQRLGKKEEQLREKEARLEGASAAPAAGATGTSEPGVFTVEKDGMAYTFTAIPDHDSTYILDYFNATSTHKLTTHEGKLCGSPVKGGEYLLQPIPLSVFVTCGAIKNRAFRKHTTMGYVRTSFEKDSNWVIFIQCKHGGSKQALSDDSQIPDGSHQLVDCRSWVDEIYMWLRWPGSGCLSEDEGAPLLRDHWDNYDSWDGCGSTKLGVLEDTGIKRRNVKRRAIT